MPNKIYISPTTEMPVIIYHCADIDGWCSAAIVAKYLLDTFDYDEDQIISIGYNYRNYEKVSSKLEDIYGEYDNPHIYIVDVSIGDTNWEKDFKNILKFSKEQVTIIDHHSSTIAWLAEENNPLKGNYEGLISSERSAAYNCWTYFYPNKKVPKVVKMVDDHDRFVHEMMNSLELSKCSIIHNEITNPFSWQWDDLLCGNTKILNKLINDGRIIKNVQDAENEIAMKNSIEFLINIMYGEVEVDNITNYNGCGFSEGHIRNIDIKDRKTYCACALNKAGNSTVFGYDPIWDIVIPWYYNDQGMFKYSFFNTGDTCNVSIIAKNLGGGGHKAAAGAINDIFLMKLLNNVNICIDKPFNIKVMNIMFTNYEQYRECINAPDVDIHHDPFINKIFDQINEYHTNKNNIEPLLTESDEDVVEYIYSDSCKPGNSILFK